MNQIKPGQAQAQAFGLFDKFKLKHSLYAWFKLKPSLNILHLLST